MYHCDFWGPALAGFSLGASLVLVIFTILRRLEEKLDENDKDEDGKEID